jgi:type IV pilus assembly protein PilM
MARTVVGLDLGPGELRAAEVSPGRKVRRVAVLATEAIDDRGELVDGDLLAKDLRRLWKSGRLRSRSVVVGLASPSISTRPIEFPKVPIEHARSAARFEVEELLPFSLDDALVGVEIWPESPDAQTTRALVIAAPGSLIDTVMGAMADAHLQVVDVRLAAASVAQTLSKDAPGGVVVANVGAARSSVAICENGRSRLIRQLLAGSEPGTSLGDELEFELSRIQGFRRGGAASGREQPSDEDMRLGPVVEAVRSSIEFHLGQRDAVQIEQIVVTGTDRHTPGLVERLAEMLGIAVVVAPELAKDSRADAAAALVLDERTPDLSLLPTTIGAARRFRRAMIASVAAAAFIGVGLFALSSSAASEVDDLESRADISEREYTTTSAKLAELAPVVAADRETRVLRDDVTGALKGDVDWRRVLAATTNAMPADSWLTAFQAQRSSPTVGAAPVGRTGSVSFVAVGIDQTTAGRWLISANSVRGLVQPRLTQSTLSPVGPGGVSRVLFTVTSDLGPAAESDRPAREVAARR